MKYDLFISYSRKDFEEVSALIEKIKAALPGISYWFDINGIESGDEFEDKIISAIDNSSYVLFALSENSIGSKWTKDEVMYAKNTDKKVIPVLLKGAQMKGWFLFKFGRVDCIDSTNQLQMDKLLHNLATWTGKPLSKNKPASAVEKTPAPKPVEKTWKVGDYYNVDGKEGVVFWVDETGKHGKIVSLDEKVLPWISERERKNNSAGLIPCYRSDIINGKNNLLRGEPEDYPAMSWCISHGPDWYLPAEKELEEFLKNDTVYAKVSRTLKEINGLNLALMGSNKLYWSSTSYDGLSARGYYMLKHWTYTNQAHLANSVRAIATF